MRKSTIPILITFIFASIYIFSCKPAEFTFDKPQLLTQQDTSLLSFITYKPTPVSDVISWKLINNDTQRKRKTELSAMKKCKYNLFDYSDSTGIYAIFSITNIAAIPKVLKLENDGLRLNYGQQKRINALEVKRQLIMQFSDTLVRRGIEVYNSNYKKSIEKIYTILEKEGIEYKSKDELLKPLPTKFPCTFQQVYDTHLKRFDQIYKHLIAHVDSIEHNTLKIKVDQVYKRFRGQFAMEKKIFEREYVRFVNFLAGRGTYNKKVSPNVWNIVLDSSVNLENKIFANNKHVKFIREDSVFSNIEFDTIYGELQDKFLQVDTMDCVPIDLDLFRLSKVEIDNKITFLMHGKSTDIKDYRPRPKRKRDNVEFVLFFEKNKTNYSRADIKPITDFLNDSSYKIVSANIAGFSSVEGSLENNIRLHKKRGKILWNLLQEVNKDSIDAQFSSEENWDMFYHQISNTEYASWRNKTKEEIKELLTKNNLEGILAPERKSIIKLNVAEKLTPEVKKKYLFKDYARAVAKGDLMEVMAIRKYASEAVKEGIITAEEAIKNIITAGPQDPSEARKLDILRFYKMLLKKTEAKDTIKVNEKETIFRAHEAALKTILERKENQNVDQYFEMASYIQKYFYSQIDSGIIPKSWFCDFQYPNNSAFDMFELNKTMYAKKFDVPCYTLSIESYYNTLKAVVLDSEKTDNDIIIYDKSKMEFYIYQFLHKYSVNNWDEKKGRFYDREVDEKVMLKQLKRLKEIHLTLCLTDFNQLIINYYVKAAYYNYQKERLSPAVMESLGELWKYYKPRIHKLSDEQALQLAKYFVWFAQNSYENKTLKWAHTILKKVSIRKNVTPETLMYFLKLSSVISDNVETDLIWAKSKLTDDQYEKLFTNKYNVPVINK